MTLWRIYIFFKRAFQGYSSKLQLINKKTHTKEWCSESCEMRRDYIIDLAWKLQYGVYKHFFSPTHCFVVSQIDCPAYARQNPDWSPDLSTFPDLIAPSQTTMRVRARCVSCGNITYGDRRFRTRAGRFAWWITGERRTRERAIYALNPDVHHKLILC